MKTIKIFLFIICWLLALTNNELRSQVLPIPYGITVPAGSSQIQWYGDIDGNGFQLLMGENQDTMYVDSPGLYFAEFTTQSCVNSSEYFVFIHKSDPFMFPITLNAAAGATGYQWYDGEEAIGGEASPSLDVQEFGEYYVLIEDELCSSESARLLVVNPQTPTAVDDAFTAEPGETITQNVMLNDGPQTDDLRVKLLDNVAQGVLKLQSNGNFSYTSDADLTKTISFSYELSNSLGLSDTAMVTLNIGCSGFDFDKMYFTQLLSPNGDGKNDSWVVEDLLQFKHCFTSTELIVFNRQKDRVYSAVDYGLDGNWWTGTKNDNTVLPSGTYYFILIIDGDETNTLNGFIHLTQ